jgi:small subunit ribosomal protein S16
MSVKIRLQKIGRVGLRIFRIVVCDESVKRNGRKLDNLGIYDPKMGKPLKVDKKKLESWLNHGAQPSDTVRKILSL